MEHFTKNVSEDDDLEYSSRSKEYNDLDIEAILERSRNAGFRKSRPLYEAPEFVARLDAFLEVYSGGSVTFQCQWKACPRPQIKWFKDDDEIPTDHPYFTIESDDKDGFVRLVLTEITKQDEGAYKCKAENMEGVASTTGYLSVTGDDSDKTLNSQQKAAQSSSQQSPTSPNISLAPHLCTILEQQSLEEREAEAQGRLPPSPLQDYIETVQKTKTWPLAKMGYDPRDFLRETDLPNGVRPDNDEDRQSSSSDTSVDSQPDTVVTTIVQPRATSTTPVKTITTATRTEQVVRAASVESDNESDTEDDSGAAPVCTVSVQLRSESGISRLTKIRQDEKRRLSLTITDESVHTDTDDEMCSEDSSELETPKVSDENETPVVGNKNVKVQSRNIEYNTTKSIAHLDNENTQKPILTTTESNNVHNGYINQRSNGDLIIPRIVLETNSENKIIEDDVTITDNSVQSPKDTSRQENLSGSPDDDFRITETPKKSIEDNSIVAENSTVSSASPASKKRHISHQESRERRSQIKKQKSLVEITMEWFFQRVTGKMGEHLELPWIYYFGFTVLCGCLCAAVKLNPFYMIVVVAILSLLSFKFILSEEEEVVIADDSVDLEE